MSAHVFSFVLECKIWSKDLSSRKADSEYLWRKGMPPNRRNSLTTEPTARVSGLSFVEWVQAEARQPSVGDALTWLPALSRNLDSVAYMGPSKSVVLWFEGCLLPALRCALQIQSGLLDTEEAFLLLFLGNKSSCIYFQYLPIAGSEHLLVRRGNIIAIWASAESI